MKQSEESSPVGVAHCGKPTRRNELTIHELPRVAVRIENREANCGHLYGLLARGSAPDTLRSQEPGAGRQKPETPPKDNENKILVGAPITV